MEHIKYVTMAKLQAKDHPLIIYISTLKDDKERNFILNVYSQIAYFRKYLKKNEIILDISNEIEIDLSIIFSILIQSLKIVCPKVTITINNIDEEDNYEIKLDFKNLYIDSIVNEYVFYDEEYYNYFYDPKNKNAIYSLMNMELSRH